MTNENEALEAKGAQRLLQALISECENHFHEITYGDKKSLSLDTIHIVLSTALSQPQAQSVEVEEFYRQGKEAVNYLYRELNFEATDRTLTKGEQQAHSEALDVLNKLASLASQGHLNHIGEANEKASYEDGWDDCVDCFSHLHTGESEAVRDLAKQLGGVKSCLERKNAESFNRMYPALLPCINQVLTKHAETIMKEVSDE